MLGLGGGHELVVCFHVVPLCEACSRVASTAECLVKERTRLLPVAAHLCDASGGKRTDSRDSLIESMQVSVPLSLPPPPSHVFLDNRKQRC